MNNSKFQYWFFIIFTIIYFLVLNRFFDVSLDKIKALEPNALGDFLAGTFSPLAFLFLILGYLQTNKSLGQNTEAISQQAIALQQQAESLKQQAKALDTQIAELKLSNESYIRQVEEMEKSVEAQQNMFLLAQKQFEKNLEEERLSKLPKISIFAEDYHFKDNRPSNSEYRFKMSIINKGAPIMNFKISSDFWCLLKGNSGNINREMVIKYNTFDNNEKIQVSCYKNDGQHPFNNKINLQYKDFEGKEYNESYTVSIKNKVVDIIKDPTNH
ncbi:hypothetical protein [Acinetobacter bereziniae]|uniref:hypothetical protein n=1 Tax=Acinetobacter bereziniae TaxID=106648 RepID=UPI0011175F53|nr:hypothetical protein [Acinetobacter bereziniae]TNL47920.1 hypothetical protein EYB59_14385 [Acinetobacter bereziniae]TNL58198.1 hypothetical protein EYY58_12350 [Acinetobacter bereziniae]